MTIIAMRMREWYAEGPTTDVLTVSVDGADPINVIRPYIANGGIGARGPIMRSAHEVGADQAGSTGRRWTMSPTDTTISPSSVATTISPSSVKRRASPTISASLWMMRTVRPSVADR